MHLILTRHGQTIQNAKREIMGQTHGTLSELGIKQAKELGKRLKNEHIDIIYSSDLKRTLDTVKEVAKHHPNAKFITDERLRESFMGSLQGTCIPVGFDWSTLPKDVESREHLCKRTKEFIDEISKKHKNKTVLVASHAGTKSAILANLFNKPHTEIDDFKGIKNTSISEFELNENGTIKKLHLINCAKHIENLE